MIRSGDRETLFWDDEGRVHYDMDGNIKLGSEWAGGYKASYHHWTEQGVHNQQDSNTVLSLVCIFYNLFYLLYSLLKIGEIVTHWQDCGHFV